MNDEEEWDAKEPEPVRPPRMSPARLEIREMAGITIELEICSGDATIDCGSCYIKSIAYNQQGKLMLTIVAPAMDIRETP